MGTHHKIMLQTECFTILLLAVSIANTFASDEQQASWLEKLFSSGELKRNGDSGSPDQEFWGVRGKRAEEWVDVNESKRSLKPNSLFGSISKKMLKPNYLFSTVGKRSLKPNSLFNTMGGKRSLKPNSLFSTMGKRNLKPNSLFGTLTKKSLKLNSLFGTYGKRDLKPNSLFTAYGKRTMKPNGLFAVGKRALKPNGLFSMSKRSIVPYFLIYDEDEDADYDIEEDEDEEEEGSEEEDEMFKRSSDPSFWAARGKRDVGDLFAARGRKSDVVAPTDFDFFAARG